MTCSTYRKIEKAKALMVEACRNLSQALEVEHNARDRKDIEKIMGNAAKAVTGAQVLHELHT